MNNHDDIRKQLSAYCGGDLEPAERMRVEEHLAECASCQAELADLQTALRLIRTTPESEPPAWLATRIMARVREQQREKRSWLQRIFFPLHVKLPIEVAALLLVCVSGYYLARNVETELKQPASRQETARRDPGNRQTCRSAQTGGSGCSATRPCTAAQPRRKSSDRKKTGPPNRLRRKRRIGSRRSTCRRPPTKPLRSLPSPRRPRS